MNNRNYRASIAQNTLDSLRVKKYSTEDGFEIDISKQLQRMMEGTIHYSPEMLLRLLDKEPIKARVETQISVVNETTFQGAQTILKIAL